MFFPVLVNDSPTRLCDPIILYCEREADESLPGEKTRKKQNFYSMLFLRGRGRGGGEGGKGIKRMKGKILFKLTTICLNSTLKKI